MDTAPLLLTRYQESRAITKVAGVCESCKIMPVRVLGPYGTGSMWTVVAGIDWAVANGADVINLSLGLTIPTQQLLL